MKDETLSKVEQEHRQIRAEQKAMLSRLNDLEALLDQALQANRETNERIEKK